MGSSGKDGSSGLIPQKDRPPDRTEALSSKGSFSIDQALVWITLAILLVFSLLTLIYPAARAFYRFDFNYNEGWNVYNTQTAMQHHDLYAAKYGWTNVGYPFLSFYLVGYLSHFSGDYLLTGRLISLAALLVSCVLVGLIVKKLTGGWGPAVFAGVFCLGLFCSREPNAVGADDPQMLAHPFFLFGLWVYLQEVPSTLRIVGLASVFIVGGNIKHNLLPAPLSVLFDLFTISSRKAVRFMVWGVFFLALSIAVNILVGGPFFLSQMLSSRPYSLGRLGLLFYLFCVPLAVPIAISVIWSIWQLAHRQGRVISFYFFSSLLLGAAFAGGAGVADNIFFDAFFAISIIMGACLDSLWKAPIPIIGIGSRWRFLVPVLLYASVFMMFFPWGLEVPKWLSDLPERQRVYQAEVSFVAAQPGPAICESLIMCYDAGKPYVLHPFGFTAGVRSGKLNSMDLVQQIAEKKYGAIQTDTPVTQKPTERFPDDVLDAINRYYVEAIKRPDCHIYVPRVEPRSAANLH
ncbi:MAG: hypothetical protein WAO35_01535 [Terriglobia bacterium]